MSASTPKVARDYLTPTGLPVRVAAATDAAIMLQSLSSDNRFAVPLSYPLAPLNGKSSCTLKTRPCTKQSEKEPRTASPLKPLAPLIDAMLLAGGHTMRGIVRERRRKASAACRGKDLSANVRARIYWLRKRGRRMDIKRQARFARKAFVPDASTYSRDSDGISAAQ